MLFFFGEVKVWSKSDAIFGLEPFNAVHEEIEIVAERFQDAVSVRSGDCSLTYEVLIRRANALAWQLIGSGARPGDAVALCAAPGLELPIAVLGILKAGCAYVPLSPRDPPSRLLQLVSGVGARIVVASGGQADRLASVAENVLTCAVDDDAPATSCGPIRRGGDDLAYILHTSGSTGQPKGVEVSHAALSHYLAWHIRSLRAEAGGLDLPLSSSICFAAGVTQLFTPLLLGRTLHILPADHIRNPDALFSWYRAHPDFGLYCVPTLWAELVRYAEEAMARGGAVTPPRAVLLSGEALRESLAASSFALWPGVRLWNLSGPTETTANATAAEVLPDMPVTLGTPIADTDVLVLDDGLRPVAPGDIGEICIAGPSVALGYRGLPDLTSERFLPSPRRVGERMFRTGDLAELGADGALRFAGRRDQMVKVRGHRIECGEVEVTLLAHPAVRQAVVLCLGDPEPELAAYVVFAADVVPTDRLRAHLAERIPDYMLPKTFTVLDAFPTLANGKVDRKVLPPPRGKRPALSYPAEPPCGGLEESLVTLWERLLGFEGIGVHDDFFDLGGTSLKVARALAAIRESLGLALSFADFFAEPTPRGIAQRAKPIANTLQRLAPLPEDTRRHCHDNQASLWLLDQTYPDQTAYTMQFAVRFDGSLEIGPLEAALGDLLRRHAVLRSRVATVGGVPMLAVRPATSISLERVFVVDDHDALLVSERRRPFDLANGPLIRFVLLTQASDRHELVVTVHHIVFDGRSIPLFFDDLVQTYATMARGGHVPAPRLAGHAEWTVWRASQAEAAATDSALAFWRDQLVGCPPVLDLPSDYPRPARRRFTGGIVEARIEPALLARLEALGRAHQATLFMTMLAAFNLLLFRHGGQRDLAVGVPVANRDRTEAEAMIGYFANTLALRCRIPEDCDFPALLASTRDGLVAALEHQAVPFERVVRALGVERRADVPPVFQTMFALHEMVPRRRIADGLSAQVREIANDAAKFDITLEGHIGNDGVTLRLVYDADLHARTSMERLVVRYRHILEAVVASPGRPVEEIPLEPPAALDLVIKAWNATDVPRTEDTALHRLVERQVVATPDALALVAGGERLSYRDLDRHANRLARRLANEGVGPGDAVGIRLDPGIDMVVSILAILKLGAAYVPLDPAYPAERLAYMVADSGVVLVVAETSARDTRTLALDWHRGDITLISDDAVSTPVDPTALAYIMYTSGSSGRPKGVMVHHGGVANYVLWMARTFPLTGTDRVLCKTSINFDISVWEIFLPLITGATLVVAERADNQAPEALAALIHRENVTHAQFVPSALRGFVDAGALATCTSLTRVFAGGEALSLRLQEQVFESFGGELHNLYGPTEASIYSCHWACRRGEPRRSVPIGRPIDNTQVYVLDQMMRPLPPGIVGDLYIGGAGLALGYRNQPELTDRVFVPDPFSGRFGARLFRTGDSARIVECGLIEYLGRGDRQVKVRGHRIELGDIEHNLASHPGVAHVKAMVREGVSDDMRIVAYVIPRPGPVPTDRELRGHLRHKLPEFMIPQRFMMLDELPLLPNGKIDLAALPRPRSAPEASTRPRQGTTASEATLTAIWQELLGTDQFGLDDSFFDVGGHSLLLARLATLINERLGARVTIVELFRFPTIAAMERHLSSHEPSVGAIAHRMARRVALHRGKPC